MTEKKISLVGKMEILPNASKAEHVLNNLMVAIDNMSLGNLGLDNSQKEQIRSSLMSLRAITFINVRLLAVTLAFRSYLMKKHKRVEPEKSDLTDEEMKPYLTLITTESVDNLSAQNIIKLKADILRYLRLINRHEENSKLRIN